MDGSPRVRTASQNVTVYNTTEVNLVLRFPAIALQLLLTNLVPTLQYANLIIHSVDNVIQAPLNLTATLGAANLTQIAGALSLVSPDLPAMLAETPRLTIFGKWTVVLQALLHYRPTDNVSCRRSRSSAPADSAFAAIADVLPTLNTSAIANVLLNHVINGTGRSPRSNWPALGIR